MNEEASSKLNQEETKTQFRKLIFFVLVLKGIKF